MDRNPVLKPLTIPDDLLDWARTPDAAIRMRLDYAQKIDALLSDNEILVPRDTVRLLGWLEGLCCEAIRLGKDDLLLGFDTFTAEWIGLHYTLSDNTVVGKNGDWTFQEIDFVRNCQTPDEAMRAAMAVKDLVSGVFPDARIGAIIDAETTEPACAGCGTTEATVMLTLESGSRYCRSCWSDLTTRLKTAEAGEKARPLLVDKQAPDGLLFGEDESR